MLAKATFVIGSNSRVLVEGSTLPGVTAASSGTHTHAGAESRRLAWRCRERPSAGHRSYRRGAAEILAGVSVTTFALAGTHPDPWQDGLRLLGLVDPRRVSDVPVRVLVGAPSEDEAVPGGSSKRVHILNIKYTSRNRSRY